MGRASACGTRCALLALLLGPPGAATRRLSDASAAERAAVGTDASEGAGMTALEAADARIKETARGLSCYSVLPKHAKTYYFDFGDPKGNESTMAVKLVRGGWADDHKDILTIYKNHVWSIKPEESKSWLAADGVHWEAVALHGRETEEHEILLWDSQMSYSAEDKAVDKESSVKITDGCDRVSLLQGGVYYDEKAVRDALEALKRDLADTTQNASETYGHIKSVARTVGVGFKIGSTVGTVGSASVSAALLILSGAQHNLVLHLLPSLLGAATGGIIGITAGLGAGIYSYAKARVQMREHGMVASDKLWQKLQCHYEAYHFCKEGDDPNAYLKARGQCPSA